MYSDDYSAVGMISAADWIVVRKAYPCCEPEPVADWADRMTTAADLDSGMRACPGIGPAADYVVGMASAVDIFAAAGWWVYPAEVTAEPPAD